MPLMHMIGLTDQGLTRKNNQDSLWLDPLEGIGVISDGMGGHRSGEVASRMAIEGIKEAWKAPRLTTPNMGIYVQQTLENINEHIIQVAHDNVTHQGMGATVDYLHFAQDRVTIGHLGDSRVYLLRSNHHGGYHLWCITIDHNVGTFLDRGLLSAPKKSHRAHLTRCLGIIKGSVPDIYQRIYHPEDIYLMCTDGIHGYLSHEKIMNGLGGHPPWEFPEILKELAYKHGAPDNLTIIVAYSPSYFHMSRSAFLVRTQDLQIVGPLKPKDVISHVLSQNIPLKSEICDGRQGWVPFYSPEIIFKIYPAWFSLGYTEIMKSFKLSFSHSLWENRSIVLFVMGLGIFLLGIFLYRTHV